MRSVPVDRAAAVLEQLIDLASSTGEPVFISGHSDGAVLISADHYRSIEETLFLLSIPGMRESIVEGMQASLDDCFDAPGW